MLKVSKKCSKTLFNEVYVCIVFQADPPTTDKERKERKEGKEEKEGTEAEDAAKANSDSYVQCRRNMQNMRNTSSEIGNF